MTTTKHEIAQSTIDMRDVAVKEITQGDSKTGKLGIAPDFVIKQMSNWEIAKPIIEEWQANLTKVTESVGWAVGDIGTDMMVKNPELDNVKLVVPTVGNDTLTFSFDRSRQVPDGKEGGTKTAYGSLSVKFDTYSTNTRPGSGLKMVKQLLAEKAAAAFGELKDKAA